MDSGILEKHSCPACFLNPRSIETGEKSSHRYMNISILDKGIFVFLI